MTLRSRGRLLAVSLGLLAMCAPLAFVPAPGHLVTPAGPSAGGVAAALATGALLAPTPSWAKGGQWGALEGKASSLVHPLVMGSLFLVMCYTGFLGWQWRQIRLIGVDVADLRKQLPKDDPETPISSAAQKIKDEIVKLTEQRSELIKGQYKDRHYQISALLLGGGIFFTVYGTFNTFFRAERLFPGPHLYAGAAVCVLWAMAAACVPYMEKGNENARNLHIALNVVQLGLFAWQLPTGFEILQKVWGASIPWF